MIEIKGIHVIGTDVVELHQLATKFTISKSWYSSTPYHHYQVINPIILDNIYRYLNHRR